MSDEPGPASKLLQKIQLKIQRSEPKYLPDRHCIFCLSKGSKSNPLSTTENGRQQVAQVCKRFTITSAILFNKPVSLNIVYHNYKFYSFAVVFVQSSE